MDVRAAHLMIMPLHAVTEVYGEPGLRRRLDLELRRLPDADRHAVADALAWATDLHAGQRRTREPYLNHVLRVTLRILCHYRVTDPEVLAAALLHDAVEDQPWAMAGLAVGAGPAPREQAFTTLTVRRGPRVARLVGAVTNPPWEEGTDRNRQYREHLATALDGEPWARVLKLSDFTDNGVGIIHTIGPRTHHLATKYSGALPLLRELLSRPDTPLTPAVKVHIGHQLDRAESRFAAILAA
jgi:hypothetical protein